MKTLDSLKRASRRRRRRWMGWFLQGLPIFGFLPHTRQVLAVKEQERANKAKLSYLVQNPTDFWAVFLHVPKNGGTSIREWLVEEAGFSDIRRMENSGAKSAYITHLNTDWLVSNAIVSRPALENAFTFAFSRNPAARAISCYRYHKRIGFIPEAWSFRRYLRYLALERPIVGGAKVARLSHAAPQVSWLRPATWSGPTIFQIEEITTAAVEIAKRLACKVNIQHLNRSGSNRLVLTDLEKELIWKLYAEDFQEFGYEMP